MHQIRTKWTLLKYQHTKHAPRGFVHIHQLTNYALKRLNEERMHQKYENIGCYKHIHKNCFPNYNLDDSIQDEKKIVLLSFLSATIRPPETPMKKMLVYIETLLKKFGPCNLYLNITCILTDAILYHSSHIITKWQK